MSTRCMIEVAGISVKLYKHHDGYPEGVLPSLVPLVKRFISARGWDPEYMLARVSQWLMNESDASMDEYRKASGRPAETEALGFGLDTQYHGDLDYVYIIKQINNKACVCCYSFNQKIEKPGKIISVTEV